jgi:CheY-like chemotaxis protein
MVTAGASVAKRLQGIRVLVLDDEREVLELVTTLLAGEGADVLAAATIEEAMLLVRQRPDIIVSDLEMPDGGGLSFIRRLRWRPIEHGGTTPAIALTGHRTVVDQTRALLAGFQIHLGKPARVDALVRAIQSLVRPSDR